MTKSIKIWYGKLKITKEETYYLIHDDQLDLFIHADKLKLGIHDYKEGWLLMSNDEGRYIGSVWINSDTDMKKVEQFLEETK